MQTTNEKPMPESISDSTSLTIGKHVHPHMSFFLAKALADVKKRNEAIERDANDRRAFVEN